MKNRRLAELAGIIHRSTAEPLNESTRENSRLLLEEEDDADLFGGDEEEDEEGDEPAEDDAEDDEDDAEDKDEATDEEPAEEVPEKLSAKEIEDLGPGEIDLQIDTVMTDIFDKSQKAFDAALQVETLHKRSMSSLLLETADYERFDMDRFAREVARYINNYNSLMDIEGMLFNKAKQQLLSQFGDTGSVAVSDFEEHMARVHDIDFTDKFSSDMIQPIATGAGSTGA